MVRETRHLWVGNLPDNIREDRIREHFKRYGRVQNVKLLAKGAGCPESSGIPGTPGGSGLCAAVAFMDIKSAAKAHGAEHTLDERPLTTVYYEPAAIPSSASAGSSPAGSGYSASSGSVNSTSRYPNHGGGSEERCNRTGPGVSSGGSGGGGGGGGGAAAGGAGPGAYSSPATERARPRDRLYRNGPTSYTTNNNNNSIVDRGSHRRWYGYASPSEGGGYTGAGSRRGRARSGSSSAASNSSSRSGSSSSAPRSPSSSSEGASSPEHRSKKHQWSSSAGNRPLAICVKNLPQRSSDSSLKDGLFHEYKKHGKVSCVKVVGVNQDRYAVVCFKKPSDVEKALEVSQDKLFFGCKISVAPYQGMDVEDNESRPYETDLDEFHPRATRTLFIGNLEKDVTPAMLREKFKHFGKIIEIDIKKQTGGAAGYAFCQYANISSVVDAIRSMDGEHVGGSRVKLGFGKSMATTCVWIDGVIEHTEKQVIALCESIGTVMDVNVCKGTGHALVVFDQVAAAQQAVKELRGFTVRGRKLQVDFASRECQDAFYEQIEKCSSSGVTSNDRYADITQRGFDSTINRYSRYEAQRRPPTTANNTYSARSSRLSRYQNNADHFEDFSERRFRYDDFSGGSGSEAGTGGGYEGSVGPALQSVVVVSGSTSSSHTPHSNMRHLQKERVHLLEQLEECQSSGDELVSPKKKFKVDKISLGRRPSGEASRHHREVSPCGKKRRGSEASKHHWRSPTPLSRSGTPLRDERPDSPLPTEPRRAIPIRRTQPMYLPLPRFAAQVLARVPPTSPLPVPDGPSAPASPLGALATPRVPSPASSPGSSPSPAEPSLDERIRSLDERYEKWSGSRTSSITECPEKSRFRPRLLDLDINDVQPSEVMRSVLAKRSVFDEDTKRLEGISDKSEPVRTVCAFSSPSSARLSPSPLNSPQSAGRSPYAGSPVVSTLKVPLLATSTPPAKGLQYPFPSHPPSGVDGTPPLPPAPSESVESDNKKLNDSSTIPRNASISERGSVLGNCENVTPSAVLFTSPNSVCSKLESRTCKSSDIKSPLYKETPSECETTLKCDEKINISSYNSDSLDRRKNDCSEVRQVKTIDTDVLADEIRDQSFKSNLMCEKPNVDNVISGVKHQDASSNVIKKSVVDSFKSESKHKLNCNDYSEISNRRRTSKDDKERIQFDFEHRKVEIDRRKKDDSINDHETHPLFSSIKTSIKNVDRDDHLYKDKEDKEKVDKERKEKERIEKEKSEKERIELERREKEKLEVERREKQKIEREKLEKDRLEKMEKERVEKERVEKERIEKERIQKEKADMERIQREKLEREKAEKERREKERLEKELHEKEKLERERKEKERLLRIENERKEKVEKERMLKEKERLDKENMEKERREKEIHDKEKSEKTGAPYESKPDRQERKKERNEKDSRKDKHDKEHSINDSNISSRDKRKERDDLSDRTESGRHRHKDLHKKDSQMDSKKESRSDNGKTKEFCRKSSRDESAREISRKDSCDSTASRHSHDSAKSKDVDSTDTREEARHNKSKHNHDNHRIRHHDKEVLPKNIINKDDVDISLKVNNLDKTKDHKTPDVEASSKEKQIPDSEKHRHYSLDSHNEVKNSDSKRKERLNSSCSLPPNIGFKRRVSSQDSIDLFTEEMKKPRLNSDTKRLLERRDSKDSQKHADKSKLLKSSKNSTFKLLDLRDTFKNKELEKCKNKESMDIKEIKERDLKETATAEKEIKNEDLHESKCSLPEFNMKNQEIENNKLRERRVSNEIESVKSECFTPEDVESDHRAFFSRLELRSSEEDEKQRAQKEKLKEIKRIQQIKQIERLMQHQENKKLKNEDRKKEIKEKRLSNERKSREDKVDSKKTRKITNSSDTSDSDEPKKHSIFDIVDEGPTYISMYDKVKARSCKNMQKQEEEKRQEKIKAKFNQFKQCRAKREEKKRSNSWDEDSDSDRDHKKSTSKSLIASSSEDELRRKHKENITTDSENDNDKSKMIQRKLMDFADDESTDDNHRKPISRKKSHSRIVSDTSDDEAFKKCLDMKKFPDQCKSKTLKALKKEKILDIKMDPDENMFETKHYKNLAHINNFMDDKKVVDAKHQILTDIKNEPVFNIEDSFCSLNIPHFDIKPKYNDVKVNNFDDIKHVKVEEVKSMKYEDIKPTHCDISSEGEGIISDSMKLSSYSENRKKHKKKQKRQKSYPSDDEAKSDYHEKMQIINSICNSKNKEHMEKRKPHNKKDKRRDKIDAFDLLFEKEKSLKKSKKLHDLSESRNEQVNNAKREEKMQDIFGPFSDESDACNKEFPLIIDAQRSKDKCLGMFSPKAAMSDFESNHESQTTDISTKDKSRDEIKKKREKKRKERKSIHKDDDSLDIDAAGKAIEASLFDDSLTDLRRPVDKVDLTSNLSSTLESDVFRFTDIDDSMDQRVQSHLVEQPKKEGKDKKKKKKKNKENRQNRKDHHHYHHHHHDKVDLTLEKETKLSELFHSQGDLLQTSIEVVDITKKVECKPPLPSPSLPILIDSPPPTESASTSTPSPTICKELSPSPTSKPVASKPGEIRRLSEKFIPGFGLEIDETISESAVKSISDFDNSIVDRKESIESNLNSSTESSHKCEDKEEKPRAIISQEETEDAVAALLGESFSGRSDGFSDCYSENTQSPGHGPTTSPGVTDNIPEDEAEEMRQAVQSLNPSELEVKPDTPQSENDLQIDTDTDEEDNSQSKTSEVTDSKPASTSDAQNSKSNSQNENVSIKSQHQQSVDQQANIKTLESVQVPTSSSTVISKGWTLSSHKPNEPSLLISTPIQGRDDKTVHIGSILHFTPIPSQQLGQCRPILSTPSKISTSYQVVNSIARPPGSMLTQPPTIKIPAEHVVYQRQSGIVISPRMSGDIRLHSPKAHGEMPQKITNMTILTTGSPNLHSPPGLHSPSGMQQRSPSQITVVRMQQPPLSPIQTTHISASSQNLSMLSPGTTNTILIQNPNAPVQLNRLPITPVLAPISKPIQTTNVALQQPKTAVASGTSTIVHPPKLIASENRKGDIRNNQDIVIGSKLLISSPILGTAQNATIMAQNRLMSASGNFTSQLPVLVGPNTINKCAERTTNVNGPISHNKHLQPLPQSSAIASSSISGGISKLTTFEEPILNKSIKAEINTHTSQNAIHTVLPDESKELKKSEVHPTTISGLTPTTDISKTSLPSPIVSTSSITTSNIKQENINLDPISSTKSEIIKTTSLTTPNEKPVPSESKPVVLEKSKCETDFEELLKQSACETKIEKPHHVTLNKVITPPVEDRNIKVSCVVANVTSAQHKVVSIINDPMSNSKDSNDSKEDSDYWSAKEVNIDSVIKKVDALCSASELSDDSEHAKTEWSENADTSVDETGLKIKQEIKVKTESFIKQDLLIKEETPNEFVNSANKLLLKNPAKRGGRARGRKISEGATERIQTRQGTKPARGSTTSPRRGRGRVKVDKKARSSSSPGVHLPGDVYDFHEDSGDEIDDVPQSKTEARPRLILTIKSPLSGTTTNVSSSVTTIPQKEIPKSTVQTVKDEKSEEFVSPAANTRKSRRLQEKDVSRNTVDDIIEDVVKNAGPVKIVNSKDSGPVRRSARQSVTKPVTDKCLDVRKSPRAGKKQKDRRNSDTSVDSSDEKSIKKDPLDITESDNSPIITEPAVNSDILNVPVTEVPVTPTTNVISKPPKKMISEINAKLASQITTQTIDDQVKLESCVKANELEATNDVSKTESIVTKDAEKPESKENETLIAITVENQSDVVEEKSLKSEGSEELMLDPATGEMIYMKRGVDGVLVPVSNTSSLVTPTSNANSDRLLTSLHPTTLSTCITTLSQSAENVTSVVKSPVPHIQTPKLQFQPAITFAPVSTISTPVMRSTSSEMTGGVSSIVVATSAVTSLSPILSSSVTTTSATIPSVSQPNFISKPSTVGNIVIPSSHIVSSMNSTSTIITTVVSKPPGVVSKPVLIKEICGQYLDGSQQQQQHLVAKTSGGAMAGMKMGSGPMSPHVQTGLPPKGMNQIHQMKPTSVQTQLTHPHKQVLLRPVGGVAGPAPLGPGPLGPSLPRGAQGQHASPPLHKHHTTPQPVIAGANSTRVGLTAVPSISPQAMQPGILGSPPPAHQQTSPVTPGEGMYPHFAHQHYSHYFRTHQDPRSTSSPYVARSPLGAEGSEAPSPPLELRRLPCARVPNPAQSPSLSDRSTDSPQVSVYSSSSGSRYGELEGGRYYEAPSPAPASVPIPGPPPPAHAPHRAALQHRMLMEHKTPTMQLSMGIDGGSAGDERGPSRGNAPAQGGTGMGRIQPGPPHAAHAPREADSLMMLLRRYPVMWQGLLALKNDAAAVQMHFVHGNPAVASNTLPSNGDGSTPLLRIAQRMRLEPVQLEAVARKMQMENEHCMLLALPCGRDHLDVLQQSTHLTGGFIQYLRRKLAAGIVNVAPPGHHQPLYTVHIFPSCEFANENLERIAPDLLHRVTDIAHLLIVIATV